MCVELLRELEIMENNDFSNETLNFQTYRLLKKALITFLTEKHEEIGYLNTTLVDLSFAAIKYNIEIVKFIDLVQSLEKYKFRPEELAQVKDDVKRAKELVLILFNQIIIEEKNRIKY